MTFHHQATKLNHIIKNRKAKAISQSNIVASQQFISRETKRGKGKKKLKKF